MGCSHKLSDLPGPCLNPPENPMLLHSRIMARLTTSFLFNFNMDLFFKEMRPADTSFSHGRHRPCPRFLFGKQMKSTNNFA